MNTDPVIARRAKMARLAEAGSRIGYSLVGLAVVAFVIGMLTSFAFWGPVVIACLALTTVTLAPAMVLGYAVKAADREDRERGVC